MISTAIAERLGLDQAAVDRAAALHDRATVVDASAVIDLDRSHVERFRAGGVTAVNHTVTLPDADYEPAVTQIKSARAWIDDNPGDVLLCRRADDIAEAKRTGREAIVFGPQDTRFLGTDLSHLDRFYEFGVRILQLTYQYRNFVGDGCGEPDPAGLSRFGRELVAAMNELGILIDLSHCGRPTAMEAMEASDAPVVFTHAHASAVHPHIRFKDDDLLRALADQGGVIGVTGLSPFNKLENGVRPGLREWLVHVTYLVDLLGPDHVGLGLDFDETSTPERDRAELAAYPELALRQEFGYEGRRVAGLTSAADVGNATLALISAGYDDETILKILGGNWLRVFARVWRP
ncbi:MAG: dipeptidase [Spirillospora sp.]